MPRTACELSSSSGSEREVRDSIPFSSLFIKLEYPVCVQVFVHYGRLQVGCRDMTRCNFIAERERKTVERRWGREEMGRERLGRERWGERE